MGFRRFGEPFARRFGLPLGQGSIASIAFALLDQFITPLTVGNVNGTAAEPGPGTRVVADAELKCSTSGGKLAFSGGKASSAYGDPALWEASQVRIPGLLLVIQFTITTIAGKLLKIGWSASNSGDIVTGYIFVVNSTVNIQVSSGVVVGGGLSAGTSYWLAIALNSTGAQTFIYGGAYTNPTLLYITPAISTSPLFPAILNRSTVATFDYDAVPSNYLYLARPYVSDSFSTAFGVTDGLAQVDATTPVGSGGGGVNWTQVGTWTTSSGVANASALSGGLAFALAATPTKDVWINAIVVRSAGNVGLVARYTDANNYLIAYHDGTNAKLDQVVGGSISNLISAAATYSASKAIRLELDGVNAQLYYNEVRIGSTTSINAGLTAITHGLYTTNTGNTFDNALIFPTGTGNEYGALKPLFF